MILFLEDWKKYPSAKPDLNTANTSWIRLCGILKTMGIKNHLFPLAIHNPELVGIDPYDTNLTNEQMIAISVEAKENPWYFFREIIRVPAKGSPHPIYAKATRANISIWWLFFNHITQLILQPRQTGKTLAVCALNGYILDIAGVKIDIHLLTKDDKLRTKTIQDMKDVIENLPWYLYLKDRSDVYNTEEISIKRLGNVYRTAVAQDSVKRANDIARGFTIPVHHIDEFAFIKNIEISLPVVLATATQARVAAKENNSFYGNIFTTTAGYLSSPEGRFAYKVYKDCMVWSEHLFDCENEEDLNKTIKVNSPNGKAQVLCEYNHRQLGFTDEWLRETIASNMVEGVKVEVEYLNKWQEGNESCPIPKEILQKINASLVSEPKTTITSYGYMVRWYVSDKEVESKLSNRQLVIGLDTSDAVGNDDIAMCIRDVSTGEVVGAGVYNETNLITFANWLVEFLTEFPNSVLVPERKSSGVTIIDNLLLLLPLKGEDPFKRIFNWVTNDADVNPDYRAIITKPLSNRSEQDYNKYRKEFGYATSSGGRNARDNLYGLAFNASTKYTCNAVRDKTLIRQLNDLVRRNDRIDHRPGEHDDFVIAWLLGFWFLTQAKNLSFYGISPRVVLLTMNSEVIEEQGGEEVVNEKNKQNELIQKIDSLVQQLKLASSHMQKEILVNKIKFLSSGLTEDNRDKFNIETILSEMKMKNNSLSYANNPNLKLFHVF